MPRKVTTRTPKEHELSFEDVGALIKQGSAKNIIICAGAGISTSAGIPDFRSPKTGLYHNLKKLNLDYPEQVFDIDFFRRRPEPFYQLAHELYPGNFDPTVTHSFIRLLHNKGLLLRCFTQNIDTLERRAGIPEERLVEAHGSFAGNHCISPKCGTVADADSTEEVIKKQGIPRCKVCKALVKPDIVFFGEGLPEVFFQRMNDFRHADLLIVMGTSLQVQPFASLPDRVKLDCPRLLINLEEVGDFSRTMDVVKLGSCDDTVKELADICGWSEELIELHRKTQSRNKSKQSFDTDSENVGAEGDNKVDASEVVTELVDKLKGTNL
ncbi:protein of unknown function [Taphrina deformans PYCC 5710]|uniref:NAD-dependent protein deacetylase n=1 Tax=Taphrina deformans (strain PYCC 5710 / ATCC 11124 / CBS 356.35 / IMI 108563 / JCM 9778 / NBRC 8474) TaxID=1097556 RepID=R4XIS0_TAPDE|nr:protein of unknown function [Taphrina deformans PYCC 5710]|eukprot:CCG84394.1 protein of unknown function [Taphrina deformans PYCC 5710]